MKYTFHIITKPEDEQETAIEAGTHQRSITESFILQWTFTSMPSELPRGSVTKQPLKR
jgi:hypothetical protein